MYRKNRIWIGGILALVSLATLVGVQCWMSTRSFIALDMPVSLARGYVTSRPFKINLEDNYEVEIETGWQSYYDPDCSSDHRIKTRWRLSKDGNLAVDWSESSDPGPYLGDFSGRKGTYELQFEVLSDTSCLDPGHPKLLVYTNRFPYEDDLAPISWASTFGVPIGLSLLVLGLLRPLPDSRPQGLRMSGSESIGQYFQWAQKLPLKKPFSEPPAFALLAAPCLIFVIFIMMILLAPYPQKGLYVHLLKPGHTAGDDDPLIEPIIVRVIEPDPSLPPRITINSRGTTWDKLAGDLRDQLKLRPKWVVYVTADPDVAWADTVRVIDIARGLQARVVLLSSALVSETPRSPSGSRRSSPLRDRRHDEQYRHNRKHEQEAILHAESR